MFSEQRLHTEAMQLQNLNNNIFTLHFVILLSKIHLFYQYYFISLH